MVHADAVSIEAGGIRKTCVELGQPRSQFRAVGHRVRVQEGSYRKRRLLSRRDIWNSGLQTRRLVPTPPFVGLKEERFVGSKRPTEPAREVTEPLLGFRQTIEVHEPVPRVERVGPEILEYRATKRIRARTSHDRRLSPGRTAAL